MKRLRILFLLVILLSACTFGNNEEEQGEPAGPVRTDAVKIEVNTTGLHRITPSSLADAGFTPEAMDPAAITLHSGERPVPFLLRDDGLIFYGQSPDDRYTATRPYILQIGSAGTVMESSSAAAGDAELATATISQRVILEENNDYHSNARMNGNETVWFWQTIQPQRSVTISATLPLVADGAGTVQLRLYGASYDNQVENDHDLDLVVNGTAISTLRWDGQGIFETEVELPAGTLVAGLNTILLDNSKPGATFVDISYVDRLTLTYDAPATAVDDRLSLRGVGGVVRARGFSQAPLVVNVTNPEAPSVREDATFSGGELLVSAGDGAHLELVGPAGFRRPAAISPLRATTWRAPENQADLLIITTDALVPALAPLVEARESQGLSVATIPVAEIYDNFGDGAASPESIRAFIRYTVNQWQDPAPQYVLLVGDATYDYRGYSNEPPAHHVPALMVPVAYSGETVSDTRLADIDDDMRPDLAIGRWPVNSREEVTQLVERTLAYEAGTAPTRIIFSADGTEERFATISDRFLKSSNLHDNDGVARLYGASADEVTRVWNEGSWLVSYTGHGSIDKWGKDNVLTIDSVSDINGRQTPPIVLQFTCLSGFFAHPANISLSESLLLSERGPVLLLGATSLTLSTHQEPLAISLLNALQAPANRRIGDALQEAKLALDVSNNGIREVSDTFGLIGDPSALIVRP